MKSVIYGLTALMMFQSIAYAGDCFGNNELQGKINAGAPHPTFDVVVNFSSMTAVIANNQGVVAQADCNIQPDGRKTITMKISAHIGYTCTGGVSGTDSNTVEMDCDGSNGSKNTVRGRLVRF